MQKPFIIAEMSGNHNQSLDRALAIVDAAAQSGAHAIKLQTYTPDSMTLDSNNPEFTVSNPRSLWYGQSIYALYSQGYTPREWHAPIIERAKEKGLCCFSTPFDEAAVDFLESLDVPAYKIASFECVDLPLIRRAATTGKPLIISTGMATVAEIDEAVTTARSAGCQDLTLLKCTSNYPAPATDSNLKTIAHMRELFGCDVGLSDHTLGIGVAVAAVALGATMIEKHFTLSRSEGGVDAMFSLEPHELRMLVEESERAWQAIGSVKYGPSSSDEASRSRRRSLYIAEDMKSGDRLNSKNLRRIRPGLGLSPKYYDQLLGKKVARDISKGSPVTWDLLLDE